MGQRRSAALAAAVMLVIGFSANVIGASAIAPATSCVVTSNGDQHNANSLVAPCNSTNGLVTLRSAIELFNQQKGQLSISFSPSLATPTTISLTNGALSVTDTTITDTLTITGAGIDSTIVDAHHASALIKTAGAALVLNAMTLENGQTASGASGIVAAPTTGVFSTACNNAMAANVKISSVRLKGNRVTGGIVYAGAIIGNKITIRDSVISGNTATASGTDAGYLGLVLSCDHVDLRNSTVRDNTGAASPLTGYNDGIFVGNGGVTMTNSLITNNTMTAATNGVDGVFDTNGTVSLVDSAITNNTLSSPAGGTDGVIDVTTFSMLRSSIDDNHQVAGSGMFDCAITCTNGLTIDSSSISGNTTTAGAGAGGQRGLCSQLFCAGSQAMTITNSTIAGNVLTAGTVTRLNGRYVEADANKSAGTVVSIVNTTLARNEVHLGAGSSFSGGPFVARNLTIQNSIIAENTPKNCDTAIAVTGTLTVSHTLDTDGSCAFPATNGNLKNQAAQFVGAAQVNAPGKTRTLAIAATSPAKDTADNTLCPTLDQRGVTRLADDPLCDIGAYEFVQAAVVVTPTSAPSPTPALPKAGSGGGAGDAVHGAKWLLLMLVLLAGPFLGRRLLRRRGR